MIKMLGRGAFGSVVLAKEKDTGQLVRAARQTMQPACICLLHSAAGFTVDLCILYNAYIDTHSGCLPAQIALVRTAWRPGFQ